MEPFEIDEPIPEFKEEQMLCLVRKDRYLTCVFEDLTKRGHSQTGALEVLFNANVLGDSVLTSEYEACAE